MQTAAGYFSPIRWVAPLLALSVAIVGCTKKEDNATSEDVFLGILAVEESQVIPIDLSKLPNTEWKVSFTCGCLREIPGSREGKKFLLEWRPVDTGRLEAVGTVEAQSKIVHRIRFKGSVVAAAAGKMGISVAELSALKKRTLVDARDERVRSNATLAEAATISAFRAAHLRNPVEGPVILLGDGLDERRLQSVADELAAIGIKQVRILTGGIPAWVKAGGRVQGSAAEVGPIQSVSPATVSRSLDYGQPWIIFANGAVPVSHPRLAIVANTAGKDPFSELQAAVDRLGGRPLMAVATQEGVLAAKLRTAGVQVYPFVGDLALLQPKLKPVTPVTISTDKGPGSRTAASKGGCGSCSR